MKDTRQDIRKLKWASADHRQASQLHFSIKRAKEEIARLNVEVRRLLTAMFDEHVDFQVAIAATSETNKELAHELTLIWQRRDKLNVGIADRLLLTSKLAGFTGDLSVGVREGRDRPIPSQMVLPSWASSSHVSDTDASSQPLGDEDEDEDVESEHVDNMVSFVSSLSEHTEGADD